MKQLITLFLLSISFYSTGQFYTGYYVSDPQVHAFDHFKIKHIHDHTKLDGDLIIHAYMGHDELWAERAQYVDGKEERAKLIAEYSHGEDIISVHVLKFMMDGNEWEYILLGYIAKDNHRHFIVIEEIFNDDSETKLLEFNRFDWIKGHHLSSSAAH